MFQFFVPNELILPCDERGELGQLFAAQLFYGFFYFRQAHAPIIGAVAPQNNQIATDMSPASCSRTYLLLCIAEWIARLPWCT